MFVCWVLSVWCVMLRLLLIWFEGYVVKDVIDVDVFQGGILFLGEVMVIVYISCDGLWVFVLMMQGLVWVVWEDIVEGD